MQEPLFQEITTDLSREEPDCLFHIRKEISGGFSPARVFLIEVIPKDRLAENPTPAEQEQLAGMFILKVDLDKDSTTSVDESGNHRLAVDFGPRFSQRIPELKRVWRATHRTYLLYRVAGTSFQHAQTLDLAKPRFWAATCCLLSRNLLDQLNERYRIEPDVTQSQTLHDWLGDRLAEDSPRGESLLLLDEQLCGGSKWFTMRHLLLPNPLWLTKSEFPRESAVTSRLTGFVHGDLHQGNILRNRKELTVDDYFVIDFASARRAPLFFDHAYLEFDLIRRRIGGNEARLFQILSSLSHSRDPESEQGVIWDDAPLLDCLRAFRNEIERWSDAHLPDYRPIIRSQVALARVAAGLNWAAKNLASGDERRNAFAYAAWAAKEYIDLTDDQHLEQLYSEARTLLSQPEQIDGNIRNERLLNSAFEILERFDSNRGVYILVIGKMANRLSDIEYLGRVPWSYVIDLDANSDSGGVYEAACSELNEARSVHHFGLSMVEGSVTRGTAWVMANGWVSHGEPVPQDQVDWSTTYLPIIRALFQDLRKSTAKPVRIVVLPCDEIDDYRLRRCIETIVEELPRGQTDVISIRTKHDFAIIQESHLTVSEADFCRLISSKFGKSSDSVNPTVPALVVTAGSTEENLSTIALAMNDLRYLQEDFELVHSDVLRSTTPTVDSDTFWKGGMVNWLDLHAEDDVSRDVIGPLEEHVRKSLASHRNEVIELWHHPGAGGSTLARRLAWNLRSDYPVAILNRHSKYTVERLAALSLKTRLPILLICEDAVLSAKARDEIHRELVGRNHRVVILHVLRTMRKPASEPFFVADPMGETESQRFLETYCEQCHDRERLEQLRALTHRPQFEKYRSPFFYALITHDRDFKSLDGFVRARASGLGPAAGRALEFLALATRFANGIPNDLFKRILGLRVASDLNLVETFGEGPASLIFHDEEDTRIVHPLIAEEFLQQRFGGEFVHWDEKLSEISRLFIDAVIEHSSCDATDCKELFYSLFIKRDTPPRFGGISRSPSKDPGPQDEITSREQFSPLIQRIKSNTDRQLVLAHLTEKCPGEAHYHNHLGRHRVFESREDFAQAEKDLELAVTLQPKESVHHHALGLVRRQWLYAKLENLIKNDPDATADTMLSTVRELAETAKQSFEQARQLAPDDDYGYVTQIQMTTKIVDRLMQSSDFRDRSFDELLADKSPCGIWLRENLLSSQDLLDDIERRYGGRRLTRHLVSCRTKLLGLHGNYRDAIRRWEEFLDEDPGDTLLVRRNLAIAYRNAAATVAADEKHPKRWPWPEMDVGELRRVAELMAANLDEDPTSERDVRTWFAAHRYLPEFSFLDVISRLERWTIRTNSPEPHYYLYALHFLRWFLGIEEQGEHVFNHKEQSQNLTLTNPYRGHSYEWLGKDVQTSPCRLVNNWQVGELPASENESTVDHPLLVRVQGVISRFETPRRAWIRLHASVPDIFFVPRDFFSGKDEGEYVTFFLGFTYEGLRAHSVSRGRGTPMPRDQRRQKDVSERATSRKRVFSKLEETQSKLTVERVRARQIVIDFLNISLVNRPFVPVADVNGHVLEKLGSQKKLDDLGFESIEELIDDCPEFARGTVKGTDVVTKPKRPQVVTESSGDEVHGIVSHYDAEKGWGFINCDDVTERVFVHHKQIRSNPTSLQVGEEVAFELSKNEKGYIAQSVRRV